jgi:hypothetical protein
VRAFGFEDSIPPFTHYYRCPICRSVVIVEPSRSNYGIIRHRAPVCERFRALGGDRFAELIRTYGIPFSSAELSAELEMGAQ